MPITIGSNIASLAAQRRLAENSERLGKTFERLSSGMRINRASDDPAGLAVSSKLNSDSRVYTQAIRNVNDGISLLSIADGALRELTGIATRMIELAQQAANGTYSSSQRSALDNEAQALAKEYFRISRSTEFNGMRLFDGSVQGLSLQAGMGSGALLQSSLGGKLGTGTLNTAVNYGASANLSRMAIGDLNGDGIQDLIAARDGASASVLLGNGDGTFKAKADINMSDGMWLGMSLGDLNGDGALDLVTAAVDSSLNSIFLGNGDGTFTAKTSIAVAEDPYCVSLGDLNGDGKLDMVTPSYLWGIASVELGNGDGTFRAGADLNIDGEVGGAALGDLNGDGVLDLVTVSNSADTVAIYKGKGDGTFSTLSTATVGAAPNWLALGDVNGDGTLDIVTADTDGNTLSICLVKRDGTISSTTSVAAGPAPMGVAIADMNGDGAMDIVGASQGGTGISVLLGKGDGTFNSRIDNVAGTGTTDVALGDFNGDGVMDAAATNSGSANISVFLAKTRDGVSPILPFSLKTKADALQALAPLKRTLEGIAAQRGLLGSFESRLTFAGSTLTSTVENYRAAESRIVDADIAEESAGLLRQQILQQVGASILAQANQQPDIALSLLRV